jgi:hypothetical protein
MPVINRGDDYFAVVTYTGNGTSQTISGLRFQPDFVWIKGRSGATDHALYDAQRGVQNRLESNTTDAAVSSDNGVTAFNADGFSIGSLAQVNTNGATYVAWVWKEGATQGFDIVTWAETAGSNTVNHNLGVAPALIIIRQRNTVGNWVVWHKIYTPPTTSGLYLNSTLGTSNTGATWLNSVSSSSFVYTSGQFTSSGFNNVAYLFADVAGFSRIGSFVGNGSADGVFVWTGFLPQCVMIKNITTGATNWCTFDGAREPSNVVDLVLYPNTSDAEQSFTAALDFCSNGFKLRATDNRLNASSNTYIFAAFASSPFKNSLAR